MAPTYLLHPRFWLLAVAAVQVVAGVSFHVATLEASAAKPGLLPRGISQKPTSLQRLTSPSRSVGRAKKHGRGNGRRLVETRSKKRRVSGKRVSPKEAQQKRLLAAKPIKWLHIPKCGTSFINTLTHHEGICPGLDFNTLFVNDVVTPGIQKVLDAHPGMFASSLNTQHEWVQKCTGLLGPRIMSHYGIQDEYQQVRGGHAATMMRQPEQRAISGFLDHHNFCPPDICSPAGGLREYAEKTSGCAVKLLTRGGLPCFMSLAEARVPVKDTEVVEAKRRIREDFVFVGISEEWDLSVCLFHAMFGGTCYDFELANVHPSQPGKAENTTLHDVSELKGYTDPYDTPVYEEAKSVFFEKIAKYSITRQSCTMMCSHSKRRS